MCTRCNNSWTQSRFLQSMGLHPVFWRSHHLTVLCFDIERSHSCISGLWTVNNVHIKNFISKTMNVEKWIVSFTWSKFRCGEHEAQRKIDDYLHAEHPENQFKLLIFWQNWKMITEWTQGVLKIWFCIKNNKTSPIFLILFQIIDRISSFLFPINILYRGSLHDQQVLGSLVVGAAAFNPHNPGSNPNRGIEF